MFTYGLICFGWDNDVHCSNQCEKYEYIGILNYIKYKFLPDLDVSNFTIQYCEHRLGKILYDSF